jgi:hypothetical protein
MEHGNVPSQECQDKHMQDGNSSAPGKVVASFALPTSSTGGHGRSIVVERRLAYAPAYIRRHRRDRTGTG